MSDLIRREELLHAIDEKYPSRFLTPSESVIVSWVYETIQAFPSAEPKHGHWIYKDGEMGFALGAWCCSECGEENDSLPYHKCKDPYAYAASKYCACCGARMEEK